jgi:hypothetical protein
MDIETLTNHISGLGKHYFDNACKIVLREAFNLNAINVDGSYDGGTDFTAFKSTGERINAAYQITTQKSAIKNKAYKDAVKAIEKLGVERFYFLTTINLSEIDCRKIESQISSELHIPTTCLSAKNIAGFLIEENLLNNFLDDTNYPLPREMSSPLEYREMALHSYTLLSNDAAQLKTGIYDDTVLFVLSDDSPCSEEELLLKTKSFLNLGDERDEALNRRIGALFGKNLIQRTGDGLIELTSDTSDELNSRKTIYEIELGSLASAQVDLMRNEYEINWSADDSKKVALWIANAFISEEIGNLKSAKASIVSNPLFDIEENGLDKLRNFLIKQKKIEYKKSEEIIGKLLENASDHPLIVKISRASIYLALEGSNPISSAKALGANRWSDFDILVEPTVAIPYVCSQLYRGKVNRYFDSAIKSINQAKELGAKLYIPFFYINECAGHLLKARKYNDLDLNEEELVYSNNAFVSNYYALKLQGAKIPESFMDYLCSYSSAIKTERADVKSWVRSIMTDVQSLLTRGSVEFIDVPFYSDGDCSDFEKEYMFQLNELEIEKKSHLIKHDTYALQFTNDNITKQNQHWIVLTYDRSMIAVSKSDVYKGWITNPIKFLDYTETTKPLSETKLISLVHSVATFSEKTLAAGARIIDKAVKYAAADMQDWEFKQEVEKFKEETINSIDFEKSDFYSEIDKKTDDFLKARGIDQADETDTDD